MSEPCPTACLDRVPDLFPRAWSRAGALTWLQSLNPVSAEERVLLYLVYGGRTFDLKGSLPSWWTDETLLDDLQFVLGGAVQYLRSPVACHAPKLVRRIVCLCKRTGLPVHAFYTTLPWHTLERQEQLFRRYYPESPVSRTVAELRRKLAKTS